MVEVVVVFYLFFFRFTWRRGGGGRKRVVGQHSVLTCIWIEGHANVF